MIMNCVSIYFIMDWIYLSSTNFIPIIWIFQFSLLYSGISPVSLFSYFYWFHVSSLIPLSAKLNVDIVLISPMYTHNLFVPSGCVSYSLSLFLTSSFFLAFISVYPIPVSFIKSSWGYFLSSPLLFLWLDVPKFIPLKLFLGDLVKYLYIPSSNLSTSSRVTTVSMYLYRHCKNYVASTYIISGYDDTHVPLILLG